MAYKLLAQDINCDHRFVGWICYEDEGAILRKANITVKKSIVACAGCNGAQKTVGWDVEEADLLRRMRAARANLSIG